MSLKILIPCEVPVDANVLSEPTRTKPDTQVIDWLRQNERELLINAIILGELRYGILLLPVGSRRIKLDNWFQEGIGHMRCLHWDAETGLVWADLLSRLKIAGQIMPVKDSMIAATAIQYKLTLVTRNITDFQNTGVSLYNPFTQV